LYMQLAVWEKKREFRSSKGISLSIFNLITKYFFYIIILMSHTCWNLLGAVWHMEQDNWKQEGLCYMGSRIGSRKVCISLCLCCPIEGLGYVYGVASPSA
jgi:hypothetical protein